MLLSVNNLKGLSIHATDGDLGKTDDFYFDDQDWTIRYVVVDVGSWLESRRVLVSPNSIPTIAPDLKRLMASLTKEQVKDSPDWDTEKPISRQYEALFADYYKYSYYWGGPASMGYVPYLTSTVSPPTGETPSVEKLSEIKEEIEQSHLRSAASVSGYTLEADDGEIGSATDFIFDDQTWRIDYMVIDTGKWLPGRKVLISPEWVESIDWAHSKIKAQLLRDTIKNAPAYDSPKAITRDYEERLFAYYGKPGYWNKAR